MKRILIITNLFFLSIVLYSQTNTFPSSGSAGINTLSPNAYFHIRGGSGSRGIFLELYDNPGGGASPMLLWDARNGGADYLFFARQENNNLQFSRYTGIWTGGMGILTLQGESGNVGIGTSTPNSKFVIANGNISLHIKPGYIYNGTAMVADENAVSIDIPSTKTLSFSDNVVFTGGNVGIGTTSPSHKLDVEGTIHTQEVKVDMNGWSDFVFHPTYNLRPLQEVHTYIQQNGHLPEIPTAKEVEENGVSLGEMNAKLLQKIEELTLYTIEQQKTIDKLLERVEKQGSEIEKLKNKKH